MKCFNIFAALGFLSICREVKGEVTTNTGISCSTSTCIADHTVCRDGYCHCYKDGDMYYFDGNICSIDKNKEVVMNIPSSASINVLDFLEMDGLQCGDVSSNYYRVGHLDRLPLKCFDQVFLYLGNTPIASMSPELLFDRNHCTVTFNYITYTNPNQCGIGVHGFQLVITSDGKFIAGIYSKQNGLGFMYRTADIGIADGKFSADQSICLQVIIRSLFSARYALRHKPNSQASVLETATDSVATAESFRFQVLYFKHPECVAVPTISTESCPTDTSLPLVQISKTPNDTEINVGENVELLCNFVSSMSPLDVKWRQTVIEPPSITEMISTAEYHITLDLPLMRSTLIISGFNQQHIAKYECVVDNGNNKIGSDVIHLTLKPALPAPSVPDAVRANIDQSVSIRCTIPDVHPPISLVWWETINQLIAENTEKYSIDDHTNSLSIQNVEFPDLARYRCCANNSLGHNCSGSVALVAPPVEVNISLVNEPLLYSPLRLKCSVKAFPPVMYFYMSNDQVNYTTPTLAANTGIDSDELEITSSMQVSNNGDYYCVASNGIGFETRSEIINVKAYGVVLDNVGTSSNVWYGDKANITCPIQYAYPPEVNITWLLNGTEINLQDTSASSNMQFVEFTADFNKNGIFTCKVSNGINEKIGPDISLNVLGAVPVVTSAILQNGQTYSTFLSVNQSASVSLTCNINSSPEALTVTWIKDSSGMTSIVHASPSSPNLDKASVTVSDSGDYICNVTNAVGWSIGNMVRLQVNQTTPMCPCNCEFKSKLDYWSANNVSKEELLEQMAPLMEEVLNDMKVDKTQVSAVIRKLTSAPDDRKSAQQIGSLGIVMIVGVFGFIIFFDVVSFFQWCTKRQ